ncbi:MAG: hypothetical protein HY275_15260 [Gemmatimonadetes bacterium]|nr:hypothetical protein [Gemmatimonadota bacterium]
MTWQPLDCHAHTTLSDGSLSPEELVARAHELGVRPGVADHVTRDVDPAVTSLAATRHYLDVLAPLGVAIGGEFCWHDRLWRELPDDVVVRFTHRIGSLHAIFKPGGGTIHAFRREVPAGMTPDQYMDLHVQNLLRFSLEMPVDILAHPTLLPLEFRAMPLEALWTEAREDRAIEALRRAKIAFEVSNRYRPHERFVRKVVQAGVRLSLGSDGHSLEQVADVAWPLALARSLGVKDEELYDPFAHGSRTGRFGGKPHPAL